MSFKIKLLFAICITGIIVCSTTILLIFIINIRSNVLKIYIELMKNAELLKKTECASAISKKELKELFITAEKVYNRYKILFRKKKQKDFENANILVKNLLSIN